MHNSTPHPPPTATAQPGQGRLCDTTCTPGDKVVQFSTPPPAWLPSPSLPSVAGWLRRTRPGWEGGGCSIPLLLRRALCCCMRLCKVPLVGPCGGEAPGTPWGRAGHALGTCW